MKTITKTIGGILTALILADMIFFAAILGAIASGERIGYVNGWWRGHLEVAAKIINYDREKSIAGK